MDIDKLVEKKLKNTGLSKHIEDIGYHGNVDVYETDARGEPKRVSVSIYGKFKNGESFGGQVFVGPRGGIGGYLIPEDNQNTEIPIETKGTTIYKKYLSRKPSGKGLESVKFINPFM